MAWGHVIGVVVGVVGAAVVSALAEERTERQERREARRQKRWDQRLKDEARKAQQVEADERKRVELIAQYEPTRAYWREWLGELGENQLFLFIPPGIPEKQGFDAFVLEVEDLGLRVEKLDQGVVFVPFEGLKAALKTNEDAKENENEENEEDDAENDPT